MITPSLLFTPVVIDTILETLGLDHLPALEAALSINFEFTGRGCLLTASPASPTSSLRHLIPKISLGASLETRRAFKSNVSDCQTLTQRVLEQLPATTPVRARALSVVFDLVRDVVDLLYTPTIVLAHLARTSATLELPERLCSLIITAGSALPACGHAECVEKHKNSSIFYALKSMNCNVDDKVTFTLDSDLFNSLNPTNLARSLLPLLTVLVRAETLSSLPQIPVSLHAAFFRRRIFDAPRPSDATSRVSKKPLRRSLKRKASSRLLLADVRNVSFTQNNASNDDSSFAVTKLRRISRIKATPATN